MIGRLRVTRTTGRLGGVHYDGLNRLIHSSFFASLCARQNAAHALNFDLIFDRLFDAVCIFIYVAMELGYVLTLVTLLACFYRCDKTESLTSFQVYLHYILSGWY